MDRQRWGKGASDANRAAGPKEAAAKRLVKFLDSLERFHPREITAIFDQVKATLDTQDDRRDTARRVHSELGRIL